jgi:exopolysaccharide production protein ExoY
MIARNAVEVSDTDESAVLNIESAAQVQRSAIVYPWHPAVNPLSAAIERAFSLRYTLLKRALDIALSIALLFILLPIGLAIALLVCLTSRGPVFFCEERIGRFRVPFRIFKFRSMYAPRPGAIVVDISKGHPNGSWAGRTQKRSHDPRITPLGRILRRMSLDELPQLWNVLIGDMSLVGPRPIVSAERRLYGRFLPYYDLFRPGITGLWQVSGRSDVEYARRVLFDREYASEWSCLLDIQILLRTIPAVITMRGAY